MNWTLTFAETSALRQERERLLQICRKKRPRKACSFEQSDPGLYFIQSQDPALRKHAHSNIPKILPPKTENYQIKNCDIFHISAQNIDCGYSLEPPQRGGSNKYPQSMFLSRNKKNNVYPYKPQFYYIKVGFTGVKII